MENAGWGYKIGWDREWEGEMSKRIFLLPRKVKLEEVVHNYFD